MLGKTNLLFLLVISSLIVQTFSAVLWELEADNHRVETVRKTRKERNFYRGTLFAELSGIKQLLCEDLYHSELYTNAINFANDDESKIPETVEQTTAEKTDASQYTDVPAEPAAESPVAVPSTSIIKESEGAAERKPEETGEGDDGDSTDEDSSEEDDIEVTDDPKERDSRQYPLVVKKVTIAEQTLGEHDVYVPCALINPKDTNAPEKFYLLSTAFLSGWYYVSTLVDTDQAPGKPTPEQPELSHQVKLSQGKARLSNYMARSPWMLLERQFQLEDEYDAIKTTLEILRKESPRYINLVEERNDLSALNLFKRKLLCASVLSTPIYRVEQLEATKDFDDENDKSFHNTEISVAFNNLDYDHKGFKTKCIPCHGYEDYEEDPYDDTELRLAPSFNDRDSLYVFKEKVPGEQRWLLSKYFEKVSILTHAREPVAETNIYELE